MCAAARRRRRISLLLRCVLHCVHARAFVACGDVGVGKNEDPDDVLASISLEMRARHNDGR